MYIHVIKTVLLSLSGGGGRWFIFWCRCRWFHIFSSFFDVPQIWNFGIFYSSEGPNWPGFRKRWVWDLIYDVECFIRFHVCTHLLSKILIPFVEGSNLTQRSELNTVSIKIVDFGSLISKMLFLIRSQFKHKIKILPFQISKNTLISFYLFIFQFQ